MLPFLEPKKAASIIVAQRGKENLDVAPEMESGEGIEPGLKEAAEDILRAIDSRSAVDLGHALQAAYQICMSYDEPPAEELK